MHSPKTAIFAVPFRRGAKLLDECIGDLALVELGDGQ